MRTTSDLCGRVLDGRYRMDRVVATGGMGTVYEGFDSRLERVVGVKVMNDNLVGEPGFTDRFITEARAAARLSDPHVVAVYDRGRTPDAVYLIMEYVPGRTLRQELTWGGRLPVARSLDILTGVLKGLQAAHSAGFVHGDIKPENVLIGDRGDVKVTDFGLARAIEDGDQRAHMLLGTAAYLAPEQAADSAPDPRSDLYSSGVLLFEMLTGHVPFRADSADDVLALHQTQRVPAPSAFVEVGPGIDELCAKATARNPADRFQTATDMLIAVAALRRQADPAAGTPDLVASPPPVPVMQTAALSRTAARPPADDVPMPTVFHEMPVAAAAAVATAPPPPPPTRNEPAAAVVVAPPDPPKGGAAPSKPKKGKGGRGLLLTLLAIVAAFVGYFAWQLGTTETVATPKLTGMSRSQALSALEKAGLTMRVDGEQYSEKYAAGKVLSSDPSAGEKVADGATVSVVLSKGPERYRVPNVRGMTQDKAGESLSASNLKVGQVLQDYSRKVDAGLIVRTDPSIGTPLKRGTAVSLTVSLGPEPVVVPEVRGMTLDFATTTLSESGLKTRAVEQFDESVPFGQVIYTEPLAGTTVYRGDKVTVVISKGSQFVPVPSVVGMDTKSAKATLENAGFKVATREQFGVTIANRVISQDPAGGTQVTRGTLVTLTVT